LPEVLLIKILQNRRSLLSLHVDIDPTFCCRQRLNYKFTSKKYFRSRIY